jgi:CRISPR system Cascade subunit CasB
MHILLDSSIDPDGGGDLPYRLRQMVRYLAARGIGLDWPQLLRDLRRWNYPDRPVQKAWARAYFSPQDVQSNP